MSNLVILGNFDGIHLGHQKLINSAIKYAKNNNLRTIVYTFSTVSSNKKYIMTASEKINELKKIGVDEVYIDDFYTVKNYTPEEFVKEILKSKLKAKIVFCGYNYTFGNNKSGNVEVLKKLIDTVIIDEFKVDDYKTSSSVIRNFINEGEIEEANKLLGKEFTISGTIIHGKQLGRTIGFPTANIKPNGVKICPPLGVYGVKVKVEGYDTIFPGIMNIGKNPTVSDKNIVTIETNIFDFNDDIYGKKIKIYLIKRLRKEVKFASLEELKLQIQKDKEMWGKFLNDKH